MPILKGRSIAERDRRAATIPALISERAAVDRLAGRGRDWTDVPARGSRPGEEVRGGRHRGRRPRHRARRAVAPDGLRPLLVQQRGQVRARRAHRGGRGARRSAACGAPSRTSIRRSRLRDAVPLASVVDKALEGRRYQMWLFVAFGIVALVIATTGVYATTAYGVSRRRREMNIRVALGARSSQVFGLVVRQSAAALAAGLAGGCAGAARHRLARGQPGVRGAGARSPRHRGRRRSWSARPAWRRGRRGETGTAHRPGGGPARGLGPSRNYRTRCARTVLSLSMLQSGTRRTIAGLLQMTDNPLTYMGFVRRPRPWCLACCTPGSWIGASILPAPPTACQPSLQGPASRRSRRSSSPRSFSRTSRAGPRPTASRNWPASSWPRC